MGILKLNHNHSWCFKNEKTKIIFIIFSLVFFILSCSVNDKTINNSNSEIDIYSYYIRRNQNNPNPKNYYRRSLAYIKMERFSEALDDINMAIKLNPEKEEYFAVRGILNCFQEEFNEAVIDYSEAIRLNPKHANYYNNRGSIYTLLGDLQKALDDCNIAIKIDQNFSEAYSNRGAIYYKMEKYQDALNDLNFSILLSPKMIDSYNTYNTRGYVYIKITQYDKAIDDFNQVIQFDHNYINAYIGLGTVYYLLGEYEKAELYLTYAINIDNDYSALYKRALVFAANGRYDEALKDINNSIVNYNLSKIHGDTTIEEIMDARNMILGKSTVPVTQ